MAKLWQLKKRALALKGREGDLGKEAILDNEEIATDLVATQLAQGIKSDGQKVDFSYSLLTVAIKKTKSGLAAITSHLTNYDTGESYQKLYLNIEGSDVVFGTRSDKEEFISDRMDGKAFRHSPDSKEEFIRNNSGPDTIAKIRAELKL